MQLSRIGLVVFRLRVRPVIAPAIHEDAEVLREGRLLAGPRPGISQTAVNEDDGRLRAVAADPVGQPRAIRFDREERASNDRHGWSRRSRRRRRRLFRGRVAAARCEQQTANDASHAYKLMSHAGSSPVLGIGGNATHGAEEGKRVSLQSLHLLREHVHGAVILGQFTGYQDERFSAHHRAIAIVIPVSSSTSRNTVPLAVSGRCRATTRPATWHFSPAFRRSKSLLSVRLGGNALRTNDNGCPLAENPSVAYSARSRSWAARPPNCRCSCGWLNASSSWRRPRPSPERDAFGRSHPPT